MKRFGSLFSVSALAGVLSLAAVAAAVPRPPASDAAPAAMQAATCPTPGAAVDTSKLQWKGGQDEYNAYKAAATATSSADKVKLAEAFLQKYPDSEWKVVAVNLILLSEVGTPAGVATAEQMLKTPGVPADKLGNAYLAVVLSLPDTIQASQSNFQQELDELNQAATCGEQLESSVMSDNAKPLKMYFFERAAAVVAMDRKQFPEAIADFKKLIANPVSQAAQTKSQLPLLYYWMGVCQVQNNPPDYEGGLYNLAHAVVLLGPNSTATVGVKQYLTTAYTTFHGSADGVDGLIAQANAPEMPAGFHIQDVNEVNKEKADAEYQTQLKAQTEAAHNADTFAGWKYRLQQPDQAAEQWKKFVAEYGTGICLEGKVTGSETSPDPNTKIPRVSGITMAAEEGTSATDTRFTLAEPGLPISKQPANGAHLAIKGIPESFSPNPPAPGKNFVLVLRDSSIVSSCQ